MVSCCCADRYSFFAGTFPGRQCNPLAVGADHPFESSWVSWACAASFSLPLVVRVESLSDLLLSIYAARCNSGDCDLVSSIWLGEGVAVNSLLVKHRSE